MSGLAAVGLVSCDPETGSFALPPEHALFVADESSPYFMGGWFDMLPAAFGQIDGIAQAARHGGGVAFEEFGPEMVRGIERGNGPSQRVFLVSRWLPAVPRLVGRLESGIRVADIGCGTGTAARLIAESFPASQVVGYDLSADSIAIAESHAAGRANLGYAVSSVAGIPLDPPFDLITSFDVIHDLAEPLAGLTRVREALAPGGQFLMMEPNASSNLEENLDGRGAMLYGISLLHCMTQSLAAGGAGLGAAWGAGRAREYSERAGFGRFETLETITNKFSAFYLLRP
jgi:SAM-dependent methyltransferase